VAQLALAAVVVTVLLAAAGALLGGPFLGAGGFALGAAAVPFYVHRKLQARREKMQTQLPEAFELMARVLRAGHSIAQALQAVVDGVGKPLSDEFALCLQQQNMGLAPDLALQEMVRRTPLLEMRIFAVALAIQRQTGGKLSEVLDRLAALIRARLRLRRHVQSLTAEGRMQGRVLFVLPFGLFGIMMVINRSYAELLFEQVPLLVVTVVVMIIGVVWIRRIVNIDM
jgi:tight adherence protein B